VYVRVWLHLDPKASRAQQKTPPDGRAKGRGKVSVCAGGLVIQTPCYGSYVRPRRCTNHAFTRSLDLLQTSIK
jgi:hypothetical protein